MTCPRKKSFGLGIKIVAIIREMPLTSLGDSCERGICWGFHSGKRLFWGWLTFVRVPILLLYRVAVYRRQMFVAWFFIRVTVESLIGWLIYPMVETRYKNQNPPIYIWSCITTNYTSKPRRKEGRKGTSSSFLGHHTLLCSAVHDLSPKPPLLRSFPPSFPKPKHRG